MEKRGNNMKVKLIVGKTNREIDRMEQVIDSELEDLLDEGHKIIDVDYKITINESFGKEEHEYGYTEIHYALIKYKPKCGA